MRSPPGLDPSAARRSDPGRRGLTRAWVSAAGLAGLPAEARAWACEFMLHDLRHRHAAKALAPVRQALGDARADL